MPICYNANMKTTALSVICAFAAAVAVGKCASEFSPEAYRNPPPESSPAFFWMWNCRLDPELLCGQLDEMASNGVRNVCIHPVPKSFRPESFRSEMSPDYMTDGTPASVSTLRRVCCAAERRQACAVRFQKGPLNSHCGDNPWKKSC